MESAELNHEYLSLIDMSAYTYLQSQVLSKLPIILISIFIPKDIPIDCLGVARVTTFIDPTFIKDIPADTTARFTETAITDECNSERAKKPTTIIIAPAMIGFIEPNLDIKKPEVEPTIKSISANGS